jgi:Uncharacterized protein conserved in bacteria C-term(DUF2220)
MTARLNEIAALADALATAGKVRIPLSELRLLWSTAAPRLVGDRLQTAALAAALTELKERGEVQLPATAWDTSTSPPLPRSIMVPAARHSSRVRPWIDFPWCSELGWVASLPALTESRFNDLVAINTWLAQTRGTCTPLLPMRYRSAQVFGDEKRMEAMARTGLFGPGRLSMELLACQRLPPPLAAAEVGPGADVLVVENSDPYWMAIAALRTEAAHSIGLVAWGAGKSFPSQIPTLNVDVAGRGPIRGTVWYWGDMDPDGLTIAVEAANAAAASGGPAIRPAAQLWAAMADSPVQNSGNVDWPPAAGQHWLGTELFDQLDAVRQARGRVAQESVPPQRHHRVGRDGRIIGAHRFTDGRLTPACGRQSREAHRMRPSTGSPDHIALIHRASFGSETPPSSRPRFRRVKGERTSLPWITRAHWRRTNPQNRISKSPVTGKDSPMTAALDPGRPFTGNEREQLENTLELSRRELVRAVETSPTPRLARNWSPRCHTHLIDQALCRGRTHLVPTNAGRHEPGRMRRPRHRR